MLIKKHEFPLPLQKLATDVLLSSCKRHLGGI